MADTQHQLEGSEKVDDDLACAVFRIYLFQLDVATTMHRAVSC